MSFSIGSHHFQLSLAAIAGVVIAVVILLHFGGSAAGLEAWLASAKQELQADRAWHARSQQLQTSATSARAAAAQLKAAGAHAEARVALLTDSLHRVFATQPTAAAGIALLFGACRDALTLCRQRGDSLERADSLDRLRADSAEARRQRADSVIQAGIGVKGCRFLHFFGCPSREASFVIGGGAGVLGTILTARAVKR